MAPFFMWTIISNIGAILGIVGVSAANIYAESFKAHVALTIFTVAVLAVAAQLIWSLRKWQNKNYPNGYIPVATFVRYTTTDGKHVVHENFRQIQIKHGYLTKILHRQYWTGTKEPVLSSSLQRIGTKSKDPVTAFDIIEIHFARPRYYNDTEIVHTRCSIDDSDERSSTHVEIYIQAPINLVHFRVELLHCQKPAHAGMIAWFERRPHGATSSPYEPLSEVRFDATSRSFEKLVAQPDPGYNYRLRWDRPATKSVAVKDGGRRRKNAQQPSSQPPVPAVPVQHVAISPIITQTAADAANTSPTVN